MNRKCYLVINNKSKIYMFITFYKFYATAPKEIPILRTELVTAVEVNKEAVKTNGLSANDIKSMLGISKNKK